MSNTQIVKDLWEYPQVRKLFNNNYIVFSSKIKSFLKLYNIDYSQFYDYFDINEIDTSTLDTFFSSLEKQLSKYNYHDTDSYDVGSYISSIISRIDELIDYYTENNDNELLNEIKALIDALRDLGERELANEYENKLSSLLSSFTVNVTNTINVNKPRNHGNHHSNHKSNRIRPSHNKPKVKRQSVMNQHSRPINNQLTHNNQPIRNEPIHKPVKKQSTLKTLLNLIMAIATLILY